jgi:hypothetical protein
VSKKKATRANGARDRFHGRDSTILNQYGPDGPDLGNPEPKWSPKCTWDQCSYIPSTMSDLDNHLESHSVDVLRRWGSPSRCLWQECRCKTVFKSKSAYKLHLKNIHTQPLVCQVVGCTYNRPFRNKADLERHRIGTHSTRRPFVCPFESCEAYVKTFARRDKWLQHLRTTEHQDDAFCPYFHCAAARTATSTGFATRDEMVSHF